MKNLILSISLLCSLVVAQTNPPWGIRLTSLGGGCPIENGIGGVSIRDIGGYTITSWVDFETNYNRVVVIGLFQDTIHSPLFPSNECALRINPGCMTTMIIPVRAHQLYLVTLPWWSNFGPFIVQSIVLSNPLQVSDAWRVTILDHR